MTPAEEFAKLNNIHWHEYVAVGNRPAYKGGWKCECGDAIQCSPLISTGRNPTFSHPEEILEVMMKREDWYIANWKRPCGFIWKIGMVIDVDTEIIIFHIELEFIINPAKLLTAAIEWCREPSLKEGV